MDELLGDELDMPVIPLGPQGESFVQTYQTRWGVPQFHLALPGVAGFDEAERNAVTRHDERGTAVRCLSGSQLLAAKRAANPRTSPISSFWSSCSA